MAEPRPTNEHLAELLQQVVHEVRALKDGQQQPSAEVRKLADSPGS